MRIAVVGLGGTGQWVASLLSKMLTPEDELVLIDRDKFDRGNMDRQLNCRPGTFKTLATAKALSARCLVTTKEEWFQATEFDGDFVMCCADNHRARLACLEWADAESGRMAFIGGNGFEDADAYAYKGAWKDSRFDPRIRFPEILTDKSGDPMSPPCTGAILESEPQLALANMQAATFLCRLWYFWVFRVPQFDVDDSDLRKTFEFEVRANSGRLVARKIGDK